MCGVYVHTHTQGKAHHSYRWKHRHTPSAVSFQNKIKKSKKDRSPLESFEIFFKDCHGADDTMTAHQVFILIKCKIRRQRLTAAPSSLTGVRMRRTETTPPCAHHEEHCHTYHGLLLCVCVHVYVCM